MAGIFQSGPSIQELETSFFDKVGKLPASEQTYHNIVGIASKEGLPNPPKAAEYWLKQYDAHRKRIKEDMPEPEKQPTGTTQLDVPLARQIREMIPGLDYLQAAPIEAPLGMKGDLPLGIKELLSSLPQDYQLPSPVQTQQPELSFFGPQALKDLEELLPQVTQPYIASTIPENVMSALTRQPDITSFPSGEETRTVLRDPLTGLPMKDIATGPRFAPVERNIRDAQMGDDVVTIQETAPKSGIYEILTIDGKPVKGPKKPLVELKVDLEGSTKGAIEKEIIDTNKMIGQFNESEKTFKPEFLTYSGQGTAWLQKQADKLGLGSGTKFLEQRTTWMNQSKAAFLQYRKWVTGVAGGEREMEEIAKAIPDPERNSPAEFSANLNQSRKWARVLKRWLEDTRTKGLSITQTSEIIESEEKKNINVPADKKGSNIPPPDWKKTMDIKRRFNSDRDMEGMKLGPWTSEGFEVWEDGKLMGYYD